MNKKTLKQIRELSVKLPITYVKGMKEKFEIVRDMRGKEIKNSQFFTGMSTNGSDAIQIETAPELIKVKNEVLYKVNHYRRLKRAYEGGGIIAMRKYIKWVGENNKLLNSEYETKLITDIMKFVNKQTIQPFL